MTEQDKTFITALIDGVKESIKSIKELFEEKIETIRNNQGKFRVDIIDLYEKYRLIIAAMNIADNKIIALETELKNHQTNHEKTDNRKNRHIGLTVTIIGLSVGWIITVILFILGRS